MQYRKFGKHDINVSALGFGCMRFQSLPDGTVDEEKAISQIRYAIDNGINYLDTAYVYHGGKSEVILGKALKDGYREKVYIADKNPVWEAKKHEDFEKLLDEQLERLQVDYIDFYLLHALSANSWSRIKELDVFKFVEKAKADGKIKYIGFSFHDTTPVFKDIIDGYDWDFCQMQYNYMDEFNQAGTEGLKYAASKNLAIIIMEPLLGGKLAKTPPTEVQTIWNSAAVKRTPAEWGLRWLWDHEEVTVILSGMNSMEQVKENMKTADSALANSLTNTEKELVSKARDTYSKLTKVGCTGCRYCMPCPKDVEIPWIFSMYNDSSIYNDIEGSKRTYATLKDNQKASACVECGKCEKACPQHLNIRQYLKDSHSALN
jgi:predicted aldo/keto reductase-like oxidoreductase